MVEPFPGERAKKREGSLLEEEIQREVRRYKEEKTHSSRISARLQQLARVSLLALTLHTPIGVPAKDAAGEKPVQSISVTLSDGVQVGLRAPSGTRGFLLQMPADKSPKKIIVFIPQIHARTQEELDRESEGERWGSLNHAMVSQQRTYAALKELAGTGQIAKVCSEGLDGDEEEVRETLAFYRDHMRIFVARYLAGYLPGSDIARAVERREAMFEDSVLDSQEYDELQEVVYPVMDAYTQEYRYLIGGEKLLALEGAISLCPAEREATHNAAFSEEILSLRFKPRAEWSEGERAHYQRVVHDDREDAALERATGHPEPVVGVHFGSGHDFMDAMERWNAKHADFPVAIAELKIDLDFGPLKSELVYSKGFTYNQLYAVQRAFRLASWKKNVLNDDRIEEGVQWLQKHAGEYGLSAEQVQQAEDAVRMLTERDRP